MDEAMEEAVSTGGNKEEREYDIKLSEL